MNTWTVSEGISAIVGIGGGLSFIISTRLKGNTRPRWVKKALSIAGLSAIAWGILLLIKLGWDSGINNRTLYLIEHYRPMLSGAVLGILLTLFLSEELSFRKRK